MEGGGGGDGRATVLRCTALPDTVPVHTQLSLRSRAIDLLQTSPSVAVPSAAAVLAKPTAHPGAPQHHDDQDIVLCRLHPSRARALSGSLRSHTLSTLCVLLCLDPLCVALFVRPNGHPEPEQALPTARGVQDGPRATAGRRWPKTAGQTSL